MPCYAKNSNIWIVIHKNMSSSLTDLLHDQNGWKFLPEKDYPKDWSKYFKFAVLRDPIKRFISAYLTFHNKYPPVDGFIRRMPKTTLDDHYWPQIASLPVVNQKIIYPDFWLNMETMDGWQKLRRKIKIKGRLQKLGKSNLVKKNKLKQYITPDLIRILKNYYKQDYNKLWNT